MLDIKLRTQAENNFFKLNFVFGKTMEHIRNRMDIQLATDENKVIKLITISSAI
jgi:hypothetical protein